MARYFWPALAATAAVWILVMTGGAVRTADAATACGDWPLCNGSLLPPRPGPALVEYVHRLTSVATAFLVLATTVTVVCTRPRSRSALLAAATALALLGVEIVLGAVAAHRGTGPITTVHLAVSMALFACLGLTVLSARPWPAPGAPASTTAGEGFALLSAAAAIAIYLLLLTGARVAGDGAGLACKGWPLCNGELFPAGDRLTTLAAYHRLAAAAAGILIAVLLWQTFSRQRGNRPVVMTGIALVAMYLTEVVAGAGNVWLHLNAGVRVLHLGVAALVWGALVVMTALAFHVARAHAPEGEASASGRISWRRTVAAYVNLTKPRIIELLLVTTVPAMVLAERGWPSPWLILGTLLGGTLTAGGANAINCYIDRDIDQVMRRTRRRALPGARVTPARALAFGAAIGVAGFVQLAATINLLAAVLAASAILFYVFVYTLWLKRRHDQNIVIGGAAGAIPPLVGWAAVTGRVDLPAVVLFLIVVLWTPPHFWALALRYRADYAAAGVPMLPVVRGEAATRRQIFWYSAALVASTLLLYATGGAGLVYLLVAVALGVGLMRIATAMVRRGEAYPVMKLFSFSITYLGLLSAAMIVDQMARPLLS